MKFKVDENLPNEHASILRGAGFETDTVSDEKLSGASDVELSERWRVDDSGPGFRECPSIPCKIPSRNRGLSF